MFEGTEVGAYRLLRPIGSGGMGSVWLAEHLALGRRAALKVLHPELCSLPDIVARFFNEARAASTIADPGIVQIFDFGRHVDGSAYIVMELLDGEPLDRRLERVGAFGVLECLRLLRLICTSLGAAHAKNIVHRDLKPENIFLVGDAGVTGGERPKILDFGIAKLSGEVPGKLKTRTGQVFGTPAYMSPEQCRGSGDIDHRSDIYAIGCVMFAMLTGLPPFDGETSGDQIAAHLREPPPRASSRVPGIPGVIDEILLRCLHKSPADRFSSMTALIDALCAAEQMVHRSSAATLALTPSGPVSRSMPIPTSLHEPRAPMIGSTQHVPPAARPPGVVPLGLTTLFGATGQVIARAFAPRRQKRATGGAAILLGAALLISAVAITVSRSGSHTASRGQVGSGSDAPLPGASNPALPAVSAGPSSRSLAAHAGPAGVAPPAAVPPAAITPPTAVPTPPPITLPTHPASAPATAGFASGPDAGISDVSAAGALDAATLVPQPSPHATSTTTKRTQRPSTGDKHANQRTSPSPEILDRGD